MFYQYGYFKPLVARKVERIMTRQLVPPLFVLSLVASAVLGIWAPAARTVLAGIAGAYAALVLTGAALAIRNHGVHCAAAPAGRRRCPSRGEDSAMRRSSTGLTS